MFTKSVAGFGQMFHVYPNTWILLATLIVYIQIFLLRIMIGKNESPYMFFAGAFESNIYLKD